MKNGAVRRFFTSSSGVTGIAGAALLILPALLAPLIANSRPFYMMTADGKLSFPFLRYIFAPDSPETLTEQFFNYTALLLAVLLILRLIERIRHQKSSFLYHTNCINSLLESHASYKF